MRLALVVAGGLDEGGKERVIPSLLWLLERLARRHQVHVFVLRYLSHPREYSLHGAHVHDLGRPEGFRHQQKSLLNALRASGPFDVIHAYWALPAGLHGTLAGRRMGVPAVVTLDSGEFVAIPTAGYGLQRHARQRIAVRLTGLLTTRATVCSEFQAELARTARFQPDIVALGVDTNLFTPPVARVEGPPWRLIHVASLNRIKDQPLLLNAMRRLIDTGVDAHLDIVGEDTLNGAMQQLATTLGLQSNVTFCGFKPSNELVPMYQRSHLALLTSRHEAAGVVTLEAAACGLVTLGTKVGYVADFDGTRSIAVAPADPARLADAIAAALVDRPRRLQFGANAREWAVAHNADWTANRLEEIYQEIAHR